jgi:hypothetical protein
MPSATSRLAVPALIPPVREGQKSVPSSVASFFANNWLSISLWVGAVVAWSLDLAGRLTTRPHRNSFVNTWTGLPSLLNRNSLQRERRSESTITREPGYPAS